LEWADSAEESVAVLRKKTAEGYADGKFDETERRQSFYFSLA